MKLKEGVRTDLTSDMERWSRAETTVLLDAKQFKTIAYSIISILSFIGRLTRHVFESATPIRADMLTIVAFGVWVRDCVRSLDHCYGRGDIGAAMLAGLCGIISIVMLVLWQLIRVAAERLCGVVGHVLFVLVVAGAIIGAESRSDTDLWLAIAALPALMLAVYSWHDNRSDMGVFRDDDGDDEGILEAYRPLRGCESE